MDQPVKKLETAIGDFLENERRLIERARTYPLAFGELFDRYYDEVYRYLLHRTANVELARDIAADTFHIALKKLWLFRWKQVPFSAWLFRIATNEVNGYFRKHKNYKTTSIEDFVDLLTEESNSADFELLESERELQQKSYFIKMHKLLSQLNSKYQSVIVLRFFEGKTLSEIADILAKPEGTVKSLVHRALEQLKEGMKS
ncbi:sigma-70 family RNA polymerase sigma factor [bacterium]|nr:MAG: sigma-70 family RNA polymerase sigma factor [bacterium]